MKSKWNLTTYLGNALSAQMVVCGVKKSMSLKNIVEHRLEISEPFRERKNKDEGIVNLLIRRYGLQPAIDRREINKDGIVALVQDYATMDRAWRKVLEEREDLRGKDYGDKDRLEQEKMKQLGYK